MKCLRLSILSAAALALSAYPFASNAAAQTAADPKAADPKAADPKAADPKAARALTTDEAKSKVQENKLTEAGDDIALAKSGRLLRYGVTAGAALSVHTPFLSTSGVKVESAVLSVTPYIGVLPAYWTANEERATYCSTTGLFQDGEQARRAATAISRKTAKIELESMLSWLKTVFPNVQKIDETDIRKALKDFGETPPFDGDDVVYLTMAAKSLAIVDQSQRELQEQEIVNVLAARNWRPQLATSCGWYRVGFWAGKPFGYSADVTISGKRGPTDVDPLISAGVMYVPNSYFTLLLGLTHNTVLDTTDPETKLHRGVWTATAGLGGTLDIASLLTKH